MAGRHWLLLFLVGVLRDMRTGGQDSMEAPRSQNNADSHLKMTFLTAQSSGLLFLAAGETQYLIVELINGTLRVRLQRGFGESVINATQFVVNNLESHKIDLVIMKYKMALTLDNITTSRLIPFSPKEMNIKKGLFLGGTGNSDFPYISGNLPTFRGCILEAIFDSMDLLSGSHPNVKFHGHWEDCHPDTTPSSDGSFGFLGPRSYLMFPSWNISSHGFIHLVLETSRQGRAPLLYQSGPQKSYFYLEIVGGLLQGTLDTGESIVSIQSMVYVSDSRPHRVQISVDDSEMQLTVDTSFSKISIDSLRHGWDFHGNLYLGGVDDTTLARVRESSLSHFFIDDMEYRSFTGCIKDLRINSVKRDLHEAVDSKDVIAGCQEEDYDDYFEYDESSTTGIVTTTTQINPTIMPTSTSITKLSETCKLDPYFSNLTSLLFPQLLSVKRGGSSLLELKHVRPTVDLERFGIRQSQVVFSLVESAEHGRLEFEIPGAVARKKFTLLDVANRRVRYFHDGSQSNVDKLVLEVAVPGGADVPECLRKGQRHSLLVNVFPAIAPPILVFPHGNTLRILPHGQKALTSDNIQIDDSDSSCDQLTIHVSGSSTEGHVELLYRPGEPIHEFSCIDLEESQVVFIHKSGNQAQLTLQASDSVSKSSPALLTLHVQKPQVNIAQSSWLIVSQGSSTLITSSNLPIVTNADTLGLEVLYRLVRHPRLGEVQKLDSAGQWKATETFGPSDLQKGGVRYLSTVSEFLEEELIEELTIQLQLGQHVQSNGTVQVIVKKSSLQVRKMIPLNLGRRREVSLTEQQIQVDTRGRSLDQEKLTYMILQSPRKGNLQLEGQRLTEGSHFTQKDLKSGHLGYTATIRNTKDTEDQFQFQVISDAHISPVYTYKILIGMDPNAPQLTNQLLHVLEGGEKAITPDHLFLKNGNSASFFYEVIDGPQHGMLIWKGSSTIEDPGEVGITEFTNDDILTGQLVYQHDGSETTEDDIPFVASMQRVGSATDTSGEEEEEEEEVVRGVFRVSVQPVNDNPPLQVVQKLFHVVRDGQRLLTTDDIAFSDPDSGSTDAQIVLVRYGVPFGKLVSVDDPSLLVFRFTQEDLRLHKILFVHTGPDQGSIQLQVSDGLHHLTTILEVQASSPFIHISNMTMLNVSSGGQASLTSISLSLETNLDIRRQDEIRYHIYTHPMWGKILKGGKPADSFTQEDLAGGLVVYQHGGEGNSRDHFRMSVEAHQVVAQGDIDVRVVNEMLHVVHNEKVHVFQGEAAEIKKEYLMVSAEGKLPHMILYNLTDAPSFGYLVYLSSELSSDGSPSLDSVRNFTQEDVNQGRILYLHSDSGMLPDLLTLNVTSGDGASQEIVILLEILPFNIPLMASELKVDEGGTTALSKSILWVPIKYFLEHHLEFTILEEPRRGQIVNAERRRLRSFTWNELDQEQVFYEHDDSETISDNFTIVANAPDLNRQSQPITISITVQPVNDEEPHVIINTGMQLLEGAIAQIPAQALHSEDADSPLDELVYYILPPTNGQLILKGSTETISSFSQRQLGQGDVQFMHRGEHDGGFFFNVSDGENQSEQQFFHVQAIPVAVNMETLQDLTVCPRSLQPITNQHLMAVTNEEKDQLPVIVYHIDEPPQIGQIVRWTNSEGVVLTNFTQSDIDAGLIYYEHNISNIPFWTAQDSILFHVTSPRAVSQIHHLNVTVTYQGPCPQLHTQLWKNTGIRVLERGSSPITLSNLDASNLLANLSSSSISHDVVFLLTKFPSQGHLSLHGAPLNPLLPHFLQSHLEDGSLLYTHTGPGISEDSFQFVAWLWPKSQAFSKPPEEEDTLIISEVFNVTVIGVPKLPPRVSPSKSQLQVAPGSYSALTSDHLSVEDSHTSPNKIIYTIQELPMGISLAKQGDQSVQVSQFTQEDLTKLSLVILANFTATSGSIRFNITTGHQTQLVAVLPVKVSVVHTSVLEVPQASGQSVMTIEHVPATVEGMTQNVLYKVSREPSYGQLMAKQVPVTEFEWGQLEKGEVSYVFTSFLSSRDEFGILARSLGGEELASTVTVTVTPMVRTGDQEQWPRGCTVKLGTENVDARELGAQTKSVPEFRVLRQPRGGRLLKFPGDGGKGEGTTTNNFTQRDLERGLIGVEVWEDGQSAKLQNDSILLELSASRVPPANVTVKFSTIPYNSSHQYSATMFKVAARMETTTSLETATYSMSTTTVEPTNLASTILLQPTTDLEPTPKVVSTTSHITSLNMVPVTSPLPTTNLIQTKSPEYSHNATLFNNLVPDLRFSSEDLTMGTTQDVPSNSSLRIDMTIIPTPADDGNSLGFMSAHIYSIILPVCIILCLILVGLLLLFYLLRKKKMGKHHVQKAATSSAKPENGATDRQTFRPTEPDRGIPLCEVGAGNRSNGAGGQNQQGSQYWV